MNFLEFNLTNKANILYSIVIHNNIIADKTKET